MLFIFYYAALKINIDYTIRFAVQCFSTEEESSA